MKLRILDHVQCVFVQDRHEGLVIEDQDKRREFEKVESTFSIVHFTDFISNLTIVHLLFVSYTNREPH